MEPVYLLVGQSVFLIKEQIKLYQEAAAVDPFNMVLLDGLDTEIEDVIKELVTVSFFSQTKMIVVENIDSFVRYEKDQLMPLIKYLEKPSSDVILILSAQEIPKNHSLGDALSKYAFIETIKSLELSSLPIYVHKLFSKDGYKIDGRTIEALIERTGNDLFLLHQEVEKLKTYAYDEKVIVLDDVNLLVPRNLEDNIFAFSSAYLKGDVKGYMQIYDDLLGSKINSSTILNHLFNTVNLILQTKTLLDQGSNQESVANYLKVSTGRAYHLIREAKVQNTLKLERLIKNLAKLDLEIKTGLKDEKLGFELLLLGSL